MYIYIGLSDSKTENIQNILIKMRGYSEQQWCKGLKHFYTAVPTASIKSDSLNSFETDHKSAHACMSLLHSINSPPKRYIQLTNPPKLP